MQPIPFPQVKADFRQMKGGLDLVTPRIALDPGKCFDAQNYEPATVGGYRRIDGHERYNGTAAPSTAKYWTLTASIAGSLSVGQSITGFTSGATGSVLGIFGATIVLGSVVGTFQTGESLRVAGSPIGTSTGTAIQNGANNASDNADYRLLAANAARTNIAAIPGSGPVRGVFTLGDKLYAFRDNVGETASLLYKADPSLGWTNVPLGTEIQFTAATAQINDGDIITGATSSAVATVRRAMLRTGSWTSAGAGTLVITMTSGTFASGENIRVGSTPSATAASANTAITRVPMNTVDTYVETIASSFGGALGTTRIYGCDGINRAFEFDGTYYCPIRTGMTQDWPTHVAEFRNYLVLSFGPSVQLSGIGAPYAWTAVLGAEEIAVSGSVTGFKQMASNQAGAALAVFTVDKQYTLYGTSAANFVLVPSNYDMGYAAKSIQAVSNNVYGMTARGLQAVVTTLNYGDFSFAALSFFIQPLINGKTAMVSASTTLKTKNQYRIFFTDGTGLVVGLTGEKVAGIMPLNYGKTVRCMTTATLSTGEEVCFFGCDDGFVYQDGKGTSFDGNPIEAWVRPAFNNLRSPRVRKTFRRAVFELACEGFAKVNIGYDLGYASPLAQPPAVQADQEIYGAGGYWDQFTWDEFTWDTAVVTNAQLSIDGTETNISFLFYSNRAQDDAVTLQGVNLLYNERRLVRSGT